MSNLTNYHKALMAMPWQEWPKELWWYVQGAQCGCGEDIACAVEDFLKRPDAEEYVDVGMLEKPGLLEYIEDILGIKLTLPQRLLLEQNFDEIIITTSTKNEDDMIQAKTLDNTTADKAVDQVSDLKIWGDGDMWKLLSKASSVKEGWMKSTKAMEIPGRGCLVQVTTQQGDQVAEAVTFVEDCRIEDVGNKPQGGSGEESRVIARRLVSTKTVTSIAGFDASNDRCDPPDYSKAGCVGKGEKLRG